MNIRTDEDAAVDHAREDEHSMEETADLEARAATLAERVIELEEQLGAAQEALHAGERARSVDAAIVASGAIDADAVRALLERALSQHPDASVEETLTDLRDRKPGLFRSGARGGSAMAGQVARAGNRRLAAAREAADRGDRASLLRYLRVRREQA